MFQYYVEEKTRYGLERSQKNGKNYLGGGGRFTLASHWSMFTYDIKLFLEYENKHCKTNVVILAYL